MNRSELIRATAKKGEKTIKETTVIIDALQEAILDTLKSGEDIKITGFGSLEIKDIPARKVRNPQTGEEFMADPCKIVKAKLSKNVKDIAK